jgi:hypothetical protein
VRVVREDPVQPGLLYAGTERGVYVSFTDGARWEPLRRAGLRSKPGDGTLPPVPVHDLAVKEGDLVAGTHGRSFYIIDDLSPLRAAHPRGHREGRAPVRPARRLPHAVGGRARRRRRAPGGAEPGLGRHGLLLAQAGEPRGHPRLPRRPRRGDQAVHEQAGLAHRARLGARRQREARAARLARARRALGRLGAEAAGVERGRGRGAAGAATRDGPRRTAAAACEWPTRRGSTASPGTCATPTRARSRT